MILKILISVSFIFQDTWAGGRDTSFVTNDTLKTFFDAFQVDPFTSSDTLFISRDSLFLIPSSSIFDQEGLEVRGISIKSEDTVFVGILHPTSNQSNYKVFYTLDSLYFTSGRVMFDTKIFNSIRRMFYLKSYGNSLWLGSLSGAGWIFYSPELSTLPPSNFYWTNSGAYASGNLLSDFFVSSDFKMYCSTNKGKILRYLKTKNLWKTIYTYPSQPGNEPNAEALFRLSLIHI